MFSKDHKTFRRFLTISAFLIYTSNFIHNIDALFTVPDCIKSSSLLEVTSQGAVKFHKVEEFIDIQEESVRVVLSNEAVSTYSGDYTSYFRINDKGSKSNIDLNHLVVFSHRDQLCKVVLIQNWQLNELTNYLLLLYNSYKFTAPSVEFQSISIGPTSLLQFIQINAALFILQDEIYIEDLLKDMYLFEARDYSNEGSTAIIISCAIPKSFISNDKLKKFTTSLADLETDAFPRFVMVLELDANDEYNNLTSKELYEFNGLNLDRIKVEFDIVHERVADNYVSLDFGALDFRNPFEIPRGSGCSLGIHQRTLKIGAVQFSGAYQAKDMLYERYIAYDGYTNLLRLDSIDDYKLVYNVRKKKAFYSTETTGDKCVSMDLRSKDSDTSLADISSMKDIFGFDEHTPLVYMGTIQLEDGIHCAVFEHEIYPNQIPLLLKLNLRLRVYSNSRVFLTYYFTSDIHITNFQDRYAYRGLWLKRVELLMMISVSRYKLLGSQITFSQSSWDLESIGTRDGPVLHPARTFDILECFSEIRQQQTHLQLDLTQDVISDWLGSCDQLSDLDETIEEGAIQILATQLGLSRAQINELEVLIFDGGYGSCVCKLNCILVNHMDNIFVPSHIGWVDNINSNLFMMNVKVVSRQENLIMSECFMKLASKYQVEDLRDELAMIYCMGAGFCGYIKTDELSLLDFKAKDESTDDYTLTGHSCEVHKLLKSLDTDKMIDDKLSRDNIERTLKKAYFPIQLETHDPIAKQIEAITVRLKPTSVTITRGGGPELLGTLVASELCYSSKTHLANSSMGTMNVSVTELTFDKHHSIVYCHRACQLSPNCITYSYSSSDMICSLSNIPLQMISQLDDLSNLRHETSCQIYLLNSMYLFEGINIINYSLLSRLAESTSPPYYLTIADREKCANLCHWNSFYCSEFYHSVQERVCAIEDKNQFLYKQLHLQEAMNEKYDSAKRRKFFMQQIGLDLWNKTMVFHLYKADYNHFYIKKQFSRVSQSVIQLIEGKLNQMSTIYDITRNDCLRECTIKKQECVIADFCKSTSDSCCMLYRTNDKHLFKQNQITLDDLVALDKNITTNSSLCTHHYLKSDSFALKRQLSLQLLQVEVVTKDAAKEKETIYSEEETLKEMSKLEVNHEESKLESFTKILSILSGIIVGFVLLYKIEKSPNSLSSSNSTHGTSLGELFTNSIRYIRDRKWMIRNRGRDNRSESLAQLELEAIREKEDWTIEIA